MTIALAIIILLAVVIVIVRLLRTSDEEIRREVDKRYGGRHDRRKIR